MLKLMCELISECEVLRTELARAGKESNHLHEYIDRFIAESNDLRDNLSTCNHALTLVQLRNNALEEVVNAAMQALYYKRSACMCGDCKTCDGESVAEKRLNAATKALAASELAALDTEPAHVCKCGGKCKGDGNA